MNITIRNLIVDLEFIYIYVISILLEAEMCVLNIKKKKILGVTKKNQEKLARVL